MIKVYGSSLCPDCINLKENLDLNKIDYEDIDIQKSLPALKEFLKIRDTNPLFDEPRSNGYIGIPAIIDESGNITLDWEEYLTDRGVDIKYIDENQSCGIDGKNC